VTWRSLALASATMLAAPGAAAQNFATPSVHWGAMTWPAIEPNEILAVNLDRFTEFDNEHIRYNAYDSTVGLNFASFTRTRRIGRSRSTLYRASLALGFANNEPTLFLQNNFLHGIRRLNEVPVEGQVKSVLGGLAVDVIQWIPVNLLGNVPFAEAGVAGSNVSNDIWAAAGWRASKFGISGLARVGTPLGGKIFPDQYLTNSYFLATLSARFPTDDWFDRITAGVVPEIEISYTWSSGYFRRTDGRGFIEGFCSLRLTWGVAAFETWNDLCRGKDRGPTFGARLVIDARSLHPKKRP
jgi:hypothetical protein